MTHSLSLSEAKARLSEVVRDVRTSREEIIITVDGRPAARVVAVEAEPRRLTDAEVAADRALMASIDRLPSAPGEFDALELIRDGRR